MVMALFGSAWAGHRLRPGHEPGRDGPVPPLTGQPGTAVRRL